MGFPEKLAVLRKASGESQSRLAMAAGVTRQSISLYEKGLTEPTLSALCAIADHYDVSLDFLCQRENEPFNHDGVAVVDMNDLCLIQDIIHKIMEENK